MVGKTFHIANIALKAIFVPLYRWRQLPGPVVDRTALSEQASRLEAQLQARKQAVEDRDLVLRELDRWAAFLAQEAADSLPRAVAMSRAVSGHHPLTLLRWLHG